MERCDKSIDGGKAFDWGRTSEDYARYRDIYPQKFYDKILARGVCRDGQKVLDLGTGTGVLPRNLYRYGAEWIGTDVSAEQIVQAKRLSAGMDIAYEVIPAEEVCYPPHTFDVITACQCHWYLDHERLMPQLARMLKPDGRLLLLYMAWLPFEDAIAGESEKLVLQYSPHWSGARETRHPITLPDCVYMSFEAVYQEEYDLYVPFTRESWNGRMKACRGIGASLMPEEIESWEREHRALLARIAPEKFEVLHYVAMLELRPKN